jgi:teichuronic acid biosynthesis glycosyltransferase TuaC
MKILYITNMFPTEDHIYNGIHVKEQIDAMKNKYSLDYQLEFINGRKSKLNYLKSIYKINKIISKKKFDIIHVHFGLSGLFLLFNPFIKIPTIVTLHGSDTNANRLFGTMLTITRLVVRRVQRVIILNDNMEHLFRKDFLKLIKIPCGVNLKSFDVPRRNSMDIVRIGFPGDKKRPGKNYILFEQIINILKAKKKDIEIVEFHNLTRDEVARKLSSLDCIVMTSVSEGSPQIVKEAMVAGVPVISSDVGDVKAILSGIENCYIINSFEPLEFADKIEKVLNLKFNQRFITGKGRIIQLGLDQESVCSKIFDTYTRLIRQNEEKN